MNCSHCNAPLDEDARFCPNCGTRVELPSQQPSETPSYVQPATATDPQSFAQAPQQPAYVSQPYAQAPQQPYAPYAQNQQPYYGQPQAQQAGYTQPYGQPYGQPGYAQQPYPPQKKKHSPLPWILGGVALLIGIGVLVYFLFFHNGGIVGGSNKSAAKLSDPQQIAEQVIRAKIETDYTTLGLYTPFDLIDSYHKQALSAFDDDQAIYAYVEENFGYQVNSIEDVVTAEHDYQLKQMQERYGEDYQIILTLNEEESKSYTGADIAQALQEESDYYFEVSDISTLSYIDVGQITELQRYRYDISVIGSKDTHENWYVVYLAQINGEWKLLGIF